MTAMDKRLLHNSRLVQKTHTRAGIEGGREAEVQWLRCMRVCVHTRTCARAPAPTETVHACLLQLGHVSNQEAHVAQSLPLIHI